MQKSLAYLAATSSFIKIKLHDYSLLIKFRLSVTVVFSSLITYIIASGNSFTYEGLLMLFVGGFLVTGAANALNQLFEKDVDKLMTRTANRPLARGSMSNTEAILAAGLFALSGTSILWIYFNELAAVLGVLSLIMYAFIYTPLKRISPVSVLVGAIPGSLPPLIGWVAATGAVSLESYIITAIQFLWQFPHFWSIAWVAYDDYAKAGFYLLPSSTGKSRHTALQNIFYNVTLIPVSLLLFIKGNINIVSAAVILFAGIMFLYYAVQLYRSCETADAKKLMFASIAYLPVVLIAILLGGKF
jgi:protoheme IX farnesyltransferase